MLSGTSRDTGSRSHATGAIHLNTKNTYLRTKNAKHTTITFMYIYICVYVGGSFSRLTRCQGNGLRDVSVDVS